MAPTQPFSSPHVHPPYPSLYLYPLNDTFIPKHISLHNGQRVKIGRQTNTKTIPGERNGYFDSKVLSRQHAEIWEDSGKIYIKDVKSSNGTFINGERLSPEGVESEPFELKNDDIVEFGIDIIGEDNKTTIHHKVAARVMCVFTDEDAHLAARVEAIPSSTSLPPNIPSVLPPATSSSGSGNNFSFAHPQRRPALQSQLGGMGGSMRPPGKNGLTFDHILSRLQGELQKSRETGTELHSLSTVMNDIHDTLGGSVPQNLPHFPQSLPPVRSQQTSGNSAPAPASAAPANPEPPAPPPEHPALSELRTELHETQASLASHVDKVRALEDMLAEHEAIKAEVAALRDLIHASSARSQHDNAMNVDSERGRRGQDDDDGSSIRTITPHELERVEEEDESEEQDESEEDRERAQRREELGRPRTPEPSGMGMDEDELMHARASETEPSTSRSRPRSPSPQPSHPALDELSARLVALSGRIDSAVEVNHSLAAQHAAAQGTITVLQDKITALEALVADRQFETQIAAAVEAQLAKAVESAVEAQLRAHKQQQPDPAEGLTALMAEWKKGVEGQWSAAQEEWGAERERLRRAFEGLENGLDARVSTVVTSHVQAQTHARLQNGDLKLHTANGTNPLGGGLVTPPSPVSVASNPGRGKARRRRRSRSPSVSSIELDDDAHKDGNGILNGDAGRSRSPSPGPSIVGSEPEVEGELEKHEGVQPLTPESSVTDAGGTDTVGQKVHLQMQTQTEVTQRLHSASTTITAAIGVLVLSVAAAAVIYRMKPE
ncbi:uncharacterized protein F5147DRAFT_712676 [Suillus discolor]|uniref:FHA domain-containing protein n=1 Tax=Suillus discolor TaxID=1912936 RepID=A0A9P7JQQ0_9AGAM|nr:uncharacterized protein F5147DRAFT_712676 [Suillus discolor]KAG2098915.1 hypothetical protein F5147DRAFT_712676 [Suillus discolor]